MPLFWIMRRGEPIDLVAPQVNSLSTVVLKQSVFQRSGYRFA